MAHRCTRPGCGRFVARGERFCRLHAGEDGRGPPEQLPFTGMPGAEDYRSLLEPDTWTAIEAAGAEQGLMHEIGVLRIVLLRLLNEEDDPARLAQSVSRVTSVLVQAARAQRALTGETADGLAEAVTQILAELGGD